jgi:competence protein ComEA
MGAFGGDMAIEDFEWRGEEEAVLATATRVDVTRASTATRLWQRLTGSVWLEPALKLGGMAALLGVLAAIGVVATTYAKPGMALPDGPRHLADALGTSWLKPAASSSPPASARAAASGAPRSAGAGEAVAPADGHAAGGGASVADKPATSDANQGGSAPVGVTAEGKVILNAASAEELTRLPGVGMKRAQAIVLLRTKLKRFKHPSDLLRVKGIGSRGLSRMLPHLVLDG